MALTREEREQFLAEPHVGALAVSAGPGRGPLTVPIWYQYAPGEDLWVLTGASSRKTQLIRAAGRFSMMAERLTPTVRYVSVEGPVTTIEPGTAEHRHEIAHRYLDEPAAARYLAFAQDHLGPEVVISMQPERWLAADLGSF
ncbi:pyridoxamine 5'-phosphate oxidase family protein [Georgenia sp. TF02-10]|uniref:pyridoxamine 5'-phosphate oxidase family protein n=1 Tax=Georgenia sp. TF02-10 TaxID=2917725 RepID=UPI001FA6BF34|nr:pyridoxamine 5'-phosphate oxidase family protein [Georgenia sp. TF02-10]UNX54333.1 pyridoxamine 5'-phosphate oxidase family protein [Georgenia sp. TF02-10]